MVQSESEEVYRSNTLRMQPSNSSQPKVRAGGKRISGFVNMAACETYLVACSSSLLFSYFYFSFSLNCSKLVSLSTFFSKETIQTVC